MQRSKVNLIRELKKGDFSNVKFISSDIPPSKQKRNVRYSEFICKGIPPKENFNILHGLLQSEHIHSLRRIKYHGQNSASVKLVWKSSEKPPTEVSLYDSADIVIRIIEMKKSEPKCYHCQKIGHISTYCRNSPVCPKCTKAHTLRDCNMVGTNNPSEPSPQHYCNKCGAMDADSNCNCNTGKPGCSNYPPQVNVSMNMLLNEIRKVAAQQENMLAEVNNAKNNRDQELHMLQQEIKEIKTQISISESRSESLITAEKEKLTTTVTETSKEVHNHLHVVTQQVQFYCDGHMAIQKMLQHQGEVIEKIKLLQENMQNQLMHAAKSTEFSATNTSDQTVEYMEMSGDSQSMLETDKSNSVQAAEVINISGNSNIHNFVSPATKPACQRVKRQSTISTSNYNVPK